MIDYQYICKQLLVRAFSAWCHADPDQHQAGERNGVKKDISGPDPKQEKSMGGGEACLSARLGTKTRRSKWTVGPENGRLGESTHQSSLNHR